MKESVYIEKKDMRRVYFFIQHFFLNTFNSLKFFKRKQILQKKWINIPPFPLQKKSKLKFFYQQKYTDQLVKM